MKTQKTSFYKNIYNLDDPCKPDIKKVANELRRTHFKLGNNPSNNLSQYKHDYPEYEQFPDLAQDPNLRKSHFKFGDNQNPYTTTYNDQNLRINEGRPAELPIDTKNDLRRSHWGLGNNNPDLHTVYQTEFTNKNPDYNQNEKPNLTKTNFKFGDDVPDYLPEYNDRYRKPRPHTAMPNKINTGYLQKSNFNLGNDNNPWSTTHFDNYVPKPLNYTQAFDPKLSQSNFKFGDDKPTETSVYQDTYTKKPINVNCLNKELVKDLRRHHFNFGNNEPDMQTLYNQDYQEPNLNEAKPYESFDPQALRKNHWKLGDDPRDYSTTYNNTYRKKNPIKNEQEPNKNFISSLNFLKGEGQYNTDYNDNYKPNDINPDENPMLDALKNDIRKSHLKFDHPNDWTTNYNNQFQYDPRLADQSKLDPNLLKDLRATHFKLGYDDGIGNSTYNDNFVPQQLTFKAAQDPGLQKSHIPLFKEGEFNGDSTYNSDFVPKPIEPPCPEDEEEEKNFYLKNYCC